MNDAVSETGEPDDRDRREKTVGRTGSTDAAGASEETFDEPAVRPATDEWTTASLVHASILLTLVLAFAGGVGAVLGLVIPLVIYLSHRERSRFIAFHALQTLIYQGVGILIYALVVAVTVATATVAWTISGLLSVVFIGFLLMPLALLVTVLMVILLLGIPLVWVGYGLYAAYRIYEGYDFRYWLLGEWVEREVRV
jgi:uncharacterized Tic20 family protein